MSSSNGCFAGTGRGSLLHLPPGGTSCSTAAAAVAHWSSVRRTRCTSSSPRLAWPATTNVAATMQRQHVVLSATKQPQQTQPKQWQQQGNESLQENGYAATADGRASASTTGETQAVGRSRSRRPRGPVHRRTAASLMRQFEGVEAHLGAEMVAWQHAQEEAFMELIASGAPPETLDAATRAHERALSRVSASLLGTAEHRGGGSMGAEHRGEGSMASQRHGGFWGPPVGRTRVLDAGGAAAAAAGAAAVAAQKAAPVVTTAGRRHPRGASRTGPASAPPLPPPPSSPLHVPEPTPQLAADAAAAAAAAGRAQRYSSQQAGAAVIAGALAAEPLDAATLDALDIVYLHFAMPRLVEWRLGHLLPRLATCVLHCVLYSPPVCPGAP